MNLRLLKPSPALAGIVEVYWIYAGPPPAHPFDRVLPKGREELIVNLMDGELRCYEPSGELHRRTRGPLVSGMDRGFYVIDTRQQQEIMGVHLAPGALWRLLDVRADELAGRRIGLADLWGREAPWLWERLMACRGLDRRLRLLDRELLRLKVRTLHPAVEWAAAQFCLHPGQVAVRAVAEEAGLSPRRFQELFTRQIGLAPKAFARVRRFQAALARIHREASPDWAAVAADQGYADQAHMIREFREFSGLTPSGYHRRRSPFTHLVPMEWDAQPAPN